MEKQTLNHGTELARWSAIPSSSYRIPWLNYFLFVPYVRLLISRRAASCDSFVDPPRVVGRYAFVQKQKKTSVVSVH
jgi:hypothetical protein